MSHKGLRVALLGPPASGKGTQGLLLAEAFSIPYMSTGLRLRREIERGSPIGIEAEGYLSQNQYVPDRLATQLVESWIQQNQDAWVLDGYPRSKMQAETLMSVQKAPFLAIHIDVPMEILRARVAKRRECTQCAYVATEESMNCAKCGARLIVRKDDSVEGFEKRLQAYQQLTVPAVQLLRENQFLVSVDGSGSIDEVSKLIGNRLN